MSKPTIGSTYYAYANTNRGPVIVDDVYQSWAGKEMVEAHKIGVDHSSIHYSIHEFNRFFVDHPTKTMEYKRTIIECEAMRDCP